MDTYGQSNQDQLQPPPTLLPFKTQLSPTPTIKPKQPNPPNPPRQRTSNTDAMTSHAVTTPIRGLRPPSAHLGGPGVHHGRGEDGDDGGLGVQHALVQHGGVLLHAPLQRHVVVLGPAPQWVQQEDRLAVAPLHQPPVGVLHQEGVAVVDGVPQLEGEDGVCGRTRGEAGRLRSGRRDKGIQCWGMVECVRGEGR